MNIHSPRFSTVLFLKNPADYHLSPINNNGKLKICLMGRCVKVLIDTGCTASVMDIQWRHMIPELATLAVEKRDYDGTTVANGDRQTNG